MNTYKNSPDLEWMKLEEGRVKEKTLVFVTENWVNRGYHALE